MRRKLRVSAESGGRVMRQPCHSNGDRTMATI
jgi:hypothetical protein